MKKVLSILIGILALVIGPVAMAVNKEAHTTVISKPSPLIKQYFDRNTVKRPDNLKQHLRSKTAEMSVGMFQKEIISNREIKNNTIYAVTASKSGSAYYAVKSLDESGHEIIRLYDNKIAAEFQLVIQKIKHSARSAS